MTVDERGRLRCPDCGLPFARVQDGVLVIETQHYGKRHTNVLRLEDVVQLLQERERQRECA